MPAIGQPNETAHRPGGDSHHPARDRRVLGLDILRFVAVTLVIFRHVGPLQPAIGTGEPRSWLEEISSALDCGGWVGVDIFFVLSGFLVSGLIFREWMQKRDVSIGRFLLRRAFKIYPSFWFFLAAMLALAAVQHRAIEWREVLGELFFCKITGQTGLIILGPWPWKSIFI